MSNPYAEYAYGYSSKPGNWSAYLHARQLYIETGDLDAFEMMKAHVTEHDGPIPQIVTPIAWKDILIEPQTVTPSDLKCY